MNYLVKELQTLRRQKRKALALFITAGDPDPSTTLSVMEAMADNGANIIELGVPFSDPIADGPVIQRSSERALRQSVHLPAIFALVNKFRKTRKTPIVLMGYYNPILHYGLEQFVQDCKLNSVDGLIVADLPLEEATELNEICRQEEISLIFLIAPEKGNQRTAKISGACSGFLYCVNQYGTTGENENSVGDQHQVVESLRRQTDLPILLGFGIASPESAILACKSADGVIVGSWLIKTLEQSHDQPSAAALFVRTLRKAIDG